MPSRDSSSVCHGHVLWGQIGAAEFQSLGPGSSSGTEWVLLTWIWRGETEEGTARRKEKKQERRTEKVKPCWAPLACCLEGWDSRGSVCNHTQPCGTARPRTGQAFLSSPTSHQKAQGFPAMLLKVFSPPTPQPHPSSSPALPTPCALSSCPTPHPAQRDSLRTRGQEKTPHKSESYLVGKGKASL